MYMCMNIYICMYMYTQLHCMRFGQPASCARQPGRSPGCRQQRQPLPAAIDSGSQAEPAAGCLVYSKNPQRFQPGRHRRLNQQKDDHCPIAASPVSCSHHAPITIVCMHFV